MSKIHNKCKCGRKKQKQSTRCIKCFAKFASNKYAKPAFCVCGKRKSSARVELCRRCYMRNTLNFTSDKTIGFYYKKYSGNANAYVHIRTNARSVMERACISKQCRGCGYDKHVEVCHLKSISDFRKSTKLRTVNSLSNMIYLCPNCHWEYDNMDKV